MLPTDLPAAALAPAARLASRSAALTWVAGGTRLLCESGHLHWQRIGDALPPTRLCSGECLLLPASGWLRIEAGARGAGWRLIAPPPPAWLRLLARVRRSFRQQPALLRGTTPDL
ncbi:hypothetical protein [Viridibacterium curvum]|uniref:DUF2917 domain-containing protein n=1 Tax=Viridibacterium curvum TaxID=1101404 RepID=A0ABP9QPF8_9RHOO